MLFRSAVPICVRSKDVDEIVNAIFLISGSFGGINLEDIAAPRCFEIEKRLKEKCDIPIFHDDQHGIRRSRRTYQNIESGSILSFLLQRKQKAEHIGIHCFVPGLLRQDSIGG